MDILIVSRNDWANVGYVFSRCLREVGVDAEALTLNRHPFDYPESASKVSIRKMRAGAKKAKIIQFMHSQHIRLGSLKGKRVFVFHGGTDYRQRPGEINRFFNPRVEKSITQTADLLGLGAKNEVWVFPAVDTNKIKPVYTRTSEKKVLAHFPSSEKNKNTALVLDTLEEMKGDPLIGGEFDFMPSAGRVSWSENIKRISECDIYIEACAPTQGAKRYGEWGVSALEAAALGKIVVTHFLSRERYEKEFGPCPLDVANDAEELRNVLRRVISMSDDDLARAKSEMRRWVESTHSFQATGRRLMDKVYEYV